MRRAQHPEAAAEATRGAGLRWAHGLAPPGACPGQPGLRAPSLHGSGWHRGPVPLLVGLCHGLLLLTQPLGLSQSLCS